MYIPGRNTASSSAAAVIAAICASLRASQRAIRSRRRITAPAHGADHVLEPAVLELAAQAVHVHVDDVGARIELVAPHLAQERAARDRRTALAEQRREQRELGRREVEALAAHG